MTSVKLDKINIGHMQHIATYFVLFLVASFVNSDTEKNDSHAVNSLFQYY